MFIKRGILHAAPFLGSLGDTQCWQEPEKPRIINTATWKGGGEARASETFVRRDPKLICVDSGEILVAFESYFKVNSIQRANRKRNRTYSRRKGGQSKIPRIESNAGPHFGSASLGDPNSFKNIPIDTALHLSESIKIEKNNYDTN